MQTPQHGNDRPEVSLNRPDLRKLLRELLPSDADQNAFCLDCFPDIYERFAAGMDRLSKTNLLLELAAPVEIANALQRHTAKTQNGKSPLLLRRQHSHTSSRARDVQMRRDLLERLYLERDRRQREGLDFSVVQQQILALKRLQRNSRKLQEGEVLGDRYRLIERVGVGGFAQVWQAFDRIAQLMVAVKVLHLDLNEDSRRVERFERGARQMRGLDHPHVVRVLDGPDRYDEFHYFVMDYLPLDLHRAVLSEEIDRGTALQAILQVGTALDFAHRRGLIHRDVKPHNILHDGNNHARLADFDLVWAADSTGGTHTGALGTFIYAAPEAMEDASCVDQRADVYSLAMTTIFVLFGKKLTRHVIESRAQFINQLDCPESMKSLLRQSTASDPEDRPLSIEVFCSKLVRACSATDSTPRLSSPALYAPTPTIHSARSQAEQPTTNELSSDDEPTLIRTPKPAEQVPLPPNDGFQIKSVPDNSKPLSRSWLFLGGAALALLLPLICFVLFRKERPPGVPNPPALGEALPPQPSDLAAPAKDIGSNETTDVGRDMAARSDLAQVNNPPLPPDLGQTPGPRASCSGTKQALDKAWDEYRARRYDYVLTWAKDEHVKQCHHAEAWLLIGLASCVLGDFKQTNEAYQKLKKHPDEQQDLLGSCPPKIGKTSESPKSNP